MRIIIPMAGIGKRMRPHTLTVPKPLIPIAGKPIVQRLAEEIINVVKKPIFEIVFIIGHFGQETENQLLDIARKLGSKGRICYQEEPLGTAHAVLCAENSLDGEIIIAFADTLFKANFDIQDNIDASIWVQQVNNPEQFGVVKVDSNNIITDFIEKPKKFVSDLAIIGIYYFKDGRNLRKELQFLLDNKIVVKGEYQLTDALENMKNKGLKFHPGKVEEWLDCGNKDATVYTHSRILEHHKNEKLISDSVITEDSIIIKPCYIGANTIIRKSVVGPYVSIGSDCEISEAIISEAIIQNNTVLRNINIKNSMIGNHVEIKGKSDELSVGDYSVYGV